MNPAANQFLRVRVVYRSNLWRKRNGDELLILRLMYSSGIVDRASAEKRIAEILHENIIFNEVYDICCSIGYNNFGMLITNVTHIVPYAGDFPPIIYNYLTIAQIQRMQNYDVVDCKAVCRIVGTLKTIRTVEGTTYNIRRLYVVDDSKAIIVVKLWDEYACNFDHVPPFEIDVKRAIITINKYGNHLNVSNSIPPAINPSSSAQSPDFESRDSLLSSTTACPPTEGYFKMKGVICGIDFTSFHYEACNLCLEKLTKCSTNGRYYCNECSIESSDFQYKLMLKMFIGEPRLEVICYHDVVGNFFDQSADNILRALEEDLSRAEEIFNPIYNKTYAFYVNMKQIPHEDEMRLTHIVLSAHEDEAY